LAQFFFKLNAKPFILENLSLIMPVRKKASKKPIPQTKPRPRTKAEREALQIQRTAIDWVRNVVENPEKHEPDVIAQVDAAIKLHPEVFGHLRFKKDTSSYRHLIVDWAEHIDRHPRKFEMNEVMLARSVLRKAARTKKKRTKPLLKKKTSRKVIKRKRAA
jgi:hypothetical protein